MTSGVLLYLSLLILFVEQLVYKINGRQTHNHTVVNSIMCIFGCVCVSRAGAREWCLSMEPTWVATG